MSNQLSWCYLILAILFEVAGTTSMKLSQGFTLWQPSLFIFIFYLFAFLFLALSLKKLEISHAYAVWSGLGTLLIVFVGLYVFSESITLLKAASLLSIIVGVIGLRQV